MGPEEKKTEEKAREGQGRRAGDAGTGPASADALAGRTDAVAGEVPAGVGPAEAERAESERSEAKPAQSERVEPKAAEPAAAELGAEAGAAASPWGEAEASEPERPAAAAPPPPPAPAPAARSGGGRGFLAGILGSLLILALAGAAVFFTRDLWVPRLAATVAPASGATAQGYAGSAIAALRADLAELRIQLGARDERVAALEARVDQLGEKLEQAAAGGQPQAEAQPPVPDLSQPVTELDQRLGRLEGEIQRLGRLEGEVQRLAGMEQGLVGIQAAVTEVRSEVQTAVDKAERQANQPVATVLAINQLADALDRSDGYARQLDAVRVIAGDNANLKEPLDRLAAWSDSGLATLGQLQGEFPGIAQKVAQTDYRSGGEGWLDDVTNRLTSLVTVRKVGDAALASGGTDAALAQAEAALKTGDLAGAVKALEGLQGQAAEAASPWLAKARDRVAAEKALADLRLAAIAQLDAARG